MPMKERLKEPTKKPEAFATDHRFIEVQTLFNSQNI